MSGLKRGHIDDKPSGSSATTKRVKGVTGSSFSAINQSGDEKIRLPFGTHPPDQILVDNLHTGFPDGLSLMNFVHPRAAKLYHEVQVIPCINSTYILGPE
jgi:hypothetical protein